MTQIRTVKAKESFANELVKNVLTPLIGTEAITQSQDETTGLTGIAWDMDLLKPLQIKAIEKALIERAKLGFYGENEQELKANVTPELNQALAVDCIYFAAQSPASLQKFKEEVLVFAGIDKAKQVEIKQPISPTVLQLTVPVVIVVGLTPCEMGKIKSSSNVKKWGMMGGKVLGNATSGAGLMAHTLFEEAVAPSAVNLTIAGAKIGKSAVVAGAKIADIVADEGSKAILEVAETFRDAEGFSNAKGRIMEAWSIVAKKDPNTAMDGTISF